MPIRITIGSPSAMAMEPSLVEPCERPLPDCEVCNCQLARTSDVFPHMRYAKNADELICPDCVKQEITDSENENQ